MGNQKANLHTYMEDAAGAVPVRKDRSKEFNQGMQDGADHALELVRLSLGRPGGMECLDEYRRSVSTHEDDNDYRAGVSHGVELMQAKLADYVQEYGPRKSRRPDPLAVAAGDKSDEKNSGEDGDSVEDETAESEESADEEDAAGADVQAIRFSVT